MPLNGEWEIGLLVVWAKRKAAWYYRLRIFIYRQLFTQEHKIVKKRKKTMFRDKIEMKCNDNCILE